MERVSSRQNPIVKRFRDVSRGRTDEWMLLDGPHLLDEALASGIAIELAAFSERLAGERLSALLERTRHTGAHAVAVTDQVLAALTPVRQPSGVVAIAARPQHTLANVFERRPQLVLVLHDVQDPGNVGAVIRAAEGGGATGVVSGGSTADPFGWKALRGAMGSAFRLPVLAGQPVAEMLDRARAAGLRVFAATARDGTPLPDCDLRGPAAVVFGGEGAGLPQALVDAADERLTIPMRSPVESLNVAVAAALAVYEASRQRRPDERK
jgi:TrmH family RNA methyltransferase